MYSSIQECNGGVDRLREVLWPDLKWIQADIELEAALVGYQLNFVALAQMMTWMDAIPDASVSELVETLPPFLTGR